MKSIFTSLLLPLFPLAAPSAPHADKMPHELSSQGDTRVDPYYWIRDIKNPKVKKLLHAENRYLKSYFTAKDLKLKETLVAEIKTKIEETETSAEIVYGDFSYYSKAIKGQDYRQHFRKNLKTGTEEIILDENQRAKGREFFAVRSKLLSPNLNQMAWCFDFDGSGKCEVEIQDMKTLSFHKTGIEGVYWGQMVWAPNSQDLFYTLPNAAWRPDSIWIRTAQGETKKVFNETNELFNLEVSLSTDQKMIFADSSSFETSKTFFWNGSTFQELVPAQEKVMISVDHSDQGFFARSNHKHKNYGLYQFTQPGTPMSEWKEIISPASDAKLIESLALNGDIIYSLRSKGNDELHLFHLDRAIDQKIEFKEPTYDTSFAIGGAPKAVIIQYSSPLTPPRTYQLNLQTAGLKLIHEKKSPSLDSELYQAELRMVKSRDGKDIPIHMVYRKELRKPGQPQPALLYSYGSYGYTVPSAFSETLFSLLDRGFVYINAHIRGSDAQGEGWYEDGKMMFKKNTFNDFIDVSDYLIREKWTTPQQLAIRGGSAGGLLMGAVINQKPENFAAVVAEVPFVDVLTTMLDPTIPLTTQEYLQWGNPNEKAAYEYMKSYSPYDNVKKTNYPAIFVQTGVNDQQVAYWEPTKWVQKLRDFNQSKHPILMKCNMGAGHGGASGRYSRYEEVAEKYVFILKEITSKPHPLN